MTQAQSGKRCGFHRFSTSMAILTMGKGERCFCEIILTRLHLVPSKEKETFLSSIPQQFSLGFLVGTRTAVLGPDLGIPQWEVPRGIFPVNDPPGSFHMFIQSMCNWEFLLGDWSLCRQELEGQLPTGSKWAFIAKTPDTGLFSKALYSN